MALLRPNLKHDRKWRFTRAHNVVGRALVALDECFNPSAARYVRFEFAGVVRAAALAVNGDERRLIPAQEVNPTERIEHKRHVHVRFVPEFAVQRIECWCLKC
jgi:hypothetical protein